MVSNLDHATVLHFQDPDFAESPSRPKWYHVKPWMRLKESPSFLQPTDVPPTSRSPKLDSGSSTCIGSVHSCYHPFDYTWVSPSDADRLPHQRCSIQGIVEVIIGVIWPIGVMRRVTCSYLFSLGKDENSFISHTFIGS